MKKWFDDSGTDGGGDISKKKGEGIEARPGNSMHIDKKKPRGLKKWLSNSGGQERGGYFSPEDSENSSFSESEGGPKKWMRINKKKPWSLKKKITVSCAGVIAAALLGVALYFLPVLFDNMGGFTPVGNVSNTPRPDSTPYVSDGVLVTPTVNPMDELMKQADFDKLKDIVNILLIGVDHGDERDASSWHGKSDFHSDVMLILAINTNTKEVSLISLPRDTYSYIPDVDGVYRLNASINCGGGWPEDPGDDEQAPFLKVCEAVSWNIGGIPIDYYYAVNFSAVKELVDAIGGVDYDLDISFKMNGRSYTMGQQHMNGQAVLDYLRVRKDKDIIAPKGKTGDLERVKRQKNMLKEIFVEMKSSGLIFKLGDILSAFQGKLFTNVDIRDTLGFAIFAYNNIDPNNVKIYTIDGARHTLFDLQKTSDGDEVDALGLFFPSKTSRANVIKEVYGVDITKTSIYKDYDGYSYTSAAILWARMQNYVIVDKSRALLDEITAILDEDALLPPVPTTEPTPEPTEPPVGESASPEASPTEAPTPTPSPTPIPSGVYRKYGDDVRALYAQAESEYAQLAGWEKPASLTDVSSLDAVMTQFKTDVQSLCATLSVKITGFISWNDFWAVVFNTPDPSKFNQPFVHNEIYVDMR